MSESYLISRDTGRRERKLSTHRLRFLMATILTTILAIGPAEAQSQNQSLTRVRVVLPANVQELAGVGLSEDTALRVVPAAIAVENGDTLTALISSKGIRPDPNSLRVIKQLNPAIEDLDQIQPGWVINIPAVSTGTDLIELEPNWGSFQLRPLESDDVAELPLNVGLGEYRATIAGFEGDRFSPAVPKQEFLQAFEALDSSLSALRLQEGSISLGALNQIDHDTLEIQSIIDGMSRDGSARVSEADLALLKEIQEDAALKADALESRQRTDSNTEATVKSNDNKSVNGYSVFYVRWKDRNRDVRPADFLTVSSPARQTIPVGRYKMWGEKKLGDNVVSTTRDKDVRVRNDTEPFRFDLIAEDE